MPPTPPTPAGPPARLALLGRVVTMDAARQVLPRGVVYVEGPRIVAVRPASAEPPPGFGDVPRTATRGTLYPGLIELHNHLAYNVLRLWAVPKRFSNRDQWAGTAEYRRLITAPMTVVGRSPGLLPAVARYVECKALAGGTTTTQGIALFSNAGSQRFYKGVVRNVEETGAADLPDALTRIADVEARDAGRFLARLQRPTRLLLHLSEGTDDRARAHFQALRLGDDTWAITPSLVGIHAAALTDEDFEVLGARGGSAVWSPLSNLLLYGATARVDAAKRHGVRLGLGADWSPSGSKNLLWELKVARLVSARLGGVFTDAELVAMATCDAAAILGWGRALGSLEAGRRADLLVVRGAAGDPYAALLEAREPDLALVMVDGVPRLGQPALMRALLARVDPDAAGRAHAEPLRVGGRERVLYLGGDAADPALGAISLRASRAQLQDALRDLPRLARELEAPRDRALGAAPRGGAAPTWFLELDELGAGGPELRPRLPFLGHAHGGPPSAADGAADGARDVTGDVARAPALSVSALVAPMTLDPLTVADDADYLDALAAQPNLPAGLADALR